MLSRGNFYAEKQHSNKALPFGARVFGNYASPCRCSCCPLTAGQLSHLAAFIALAVCAKKEEKECNAMEWHSSIRHFFLTDDTYHYKEMHNIRLAAESRTNV